MHTHTHKDVTDIHVLTFNCTDFNSRTTEIQVDSSHHEVPDCPHEARSWETGVGESKDIDPSEVEGAPVVQLGQFLLRSIDAPVDD